MHSQNSLISMADQRIRKVVIKLNLKCLPPLPKRNILQCVAVQTFYNKFENVKCKTQESSSPLLQSCFLKLYSHFNTVFVFFLVNYFVL